YFTMSGSHTPPPFPYTTLFRSIVPVHGGDVVAIGAVLRSQLPVATEDVAGGPAQHFDAIGRLVDHHVDDLLRLTEEVFQRRDVRSEEHTSELQSRENLVCRLLL